MTTYATDIEFLVIIIGGACMFALASLMMYTLLLVAFAWPHRADGYGWLESLSKARRELA